MSCFHPSLHHYNTDMGPDIIRGVGDISQCYLQLRGLEAHTVCDAGEYNAP